MPRGTPSYERLKESVNDLRAANKRLQSTCAEQDLTIAELRRQNNELRDQIAQTNPDNAELKSAQGTVELLSRKLASLEEAYEGALKKHDDDREVWRMRASGLEDRLRKMEDEHADLLSQERYAQTVIRKALLDAVAAASGRRNTN